MRRRELVFVVVFRLGKVVKYYMLLVLHEIRGKKTSGYGNII